MHGYMCLCVCVHTCMHVCICVCVCVLACTCLRVCMCGYINSSQHQVAPDLWNCVKVEVAILGSPSLKSLMVSVDVKHQSALEVNARRKVCCRITDLNLHQYCIWLFSHMLYQLSYSCPSVLNGKKSEGVVWLQVPSTVVQEVTGGGVPDGFPPHLTDIPDINHLMKVNTVMPPAHAT